MKKINYLKAVCLGCAFIILLLIGWESYLSFREFTKSISAVSDVSLTNSLINFNR